MKVLIVFTNPVTPRVIKEPLNSLIWDVRNSIKVVGIQEHHVFMHKKREGVKTPSLLTCGVEVVTLMQQMERNE